jgi:hypothetical protein
MSDRLWDDPTIPPPGRRSGSGSWSILPYLVKSLASKPKEGPPQAREEPPPTTSDRQEPRESR